MKRFKKILKWTGIILIIFIAGISVITASRQHLTYEAPLPSIKASRDSAVIARGKHLAYNIAHCTACHSGSQNADSLIDAGKEVALTGGYLFELPVGKVYSKNITPDIETGIGKYTDEEIARILRFGVHKNGEAVFDFMPFHNLSDEDLTAVISFLRSQKPVKFKVPEHDLNLMGNLVKAFMISPVGPNGTVPVSVKPDSSVEYGKYIATNIANCGGCHTKRDMTGKYVGDPLAGGNPMKAEGFPDLTPINLTPDPSSPIYNWNQQMFINRFRAGKAIKHSHMPWNSFKRMSDLELTAIYKYLRSVTPVDTRVDVKKK